MLQAERQRLKDLGQELQVGTLFEGGEGQKTGGIYQTNGGGGVGKGEWRDSTVTLKLQFTGICNIIL